ncbi:GreA/GreB family elongation factor [Trichloromonas sp.]|uniref:GreA/GreB family elongation factor n=1 Tax=Trichloromonas sp. TaxID=3069249 RepID=UPI002A4C48E7|nr:GreA/GreB family elongation factor [Trichloromonas sp.]
MNKADLLQQIIKQLTTDLALLLAAAKSAHAAATHEENIPDNKYATLALEASYVAQGQANRASEIRRALEAYKQLDSRTIATGTVRLGALVELTDEEGATKVVFIGPLEGGLKILHGGREIVVITPASPLGRELLGKAVGDEVESANSEYEILRIT